MSGVDSSMEWKEKKKHLEAAGIPPRNIPRGGKIVDFIPVWVQPTTVSVVMVSMFISSAVDHHPGFDFRLG
jgi:hypothetical protein